MAFVLFTIGHSNQIIDDFLGLIAGCGISHVLDVRCRPVGHRFAHFNKAALTALLDLRGIRYHFLDRELCDHRTEVRCGPRIRPPEHRFRPNPPFKKCSKPSAR